MRRSMDAVVKIKHWLPALVSGICQVFGIGLLGVYGFFIAPLSREFGVGVATINVGPVFMLLAPALVGPVLGHFVDSHSIRRIMLIGVVLASLSLVGISMSSSLLLAGVGFFAYALGQTFYGPLVLNSLLIKTYQENIATALAVAAMGVSVGAVLMPYMAAWLIDNYSWRETLQVLATGVGIVLLLSIRLGLPRFPNEPGKGDALSQLAPLNRDYLRTPAFWIIGVAIAMIFNKVDLPDPFKPRIPILAP